MSYLVRKINKAKWPKENYSEYDVNDLRADAITSCLRTSNDTLSVWEITSLENTKDAVLALVSSFERLDKIDIVIIDKEEISGKGFSIEDTPGDTPIKDLVHTHKDIAGLNYQTVGEFSKVLLNSMDNVDRTKRFTVRRIKDLLIEAIDSGRLDASFLKEGVRKSLIS